MLQTQDHTGAFGPAIDYYFPVVVAFLQSLLLKGITLASEQVKDWGTPAKWGALFVLGLVVNYLAAHTGFALTEPNAQNWTTPGALAAVQTVAAGLIYRFGGHKVATA